jgi:hypothetical protein
MKRDIETHSGSWHGFMVQRLHLKGNDLMVYGVIHQYSYQGEMGFFGSLAYLCEITGATKKGIYKNLKSLEQKGLITKSVIYENNVRKCIYRAVVTISNYEDYEMQDDHVVCVAEENNSDDSVLDSGGGVLSTPGYGTEYTGGGVLSTPKYKYKYNNNNNNNNNINNIGDSSEPDDNVVVVQKMAKEYGLKIKAKDAIAILKVADNNLTRVKKALDVLSEQKKKITNITGWLITAIIDDYELAKKPYDLANKFHNFEERKNDYDELERRLLGY